MSNLLNRRSALKALAGGVAAIAFNQARQDNPVYVYPKTTTVDSLEFSAEVSDSSTIDIGKDDEYVDAPKAPEEDYFDELFRLPKSVADKVTFTGTEQRVPYYVALAIHQSIALEAGIDFTDMSNLKAVDELVSKTSEICKQIKDKEYPGQGNSGLALPEAVEVALQNNGVKTSVLNILMLSLDLRFVNKNRAIVRSKEANGIVEVYELKVDKSIEQQTKELIEAGREAGFDFMPEEKGKKKSSAYRNTEGQIEARIANGCGHKHGATKEQDVQRVFYDKSSSCSPSTARPGRSMHELGLALDLRVNGEAIANRPDAFEWLHKNAHKYGFFNLGDKKLQGPEYKGSVIESWHWSVNGL
jgi:hypothetical protein